MGNCPSASNTCTTIEGGPLGTGDGVCVGVIVASVSLSTDAGVAEAGGVAEGGGVLLGAGVNVAVDSAMSVGDVVAATSSGVAVGSFCWQATSRNSKKMAMVTWKTRRGADKITFINVLHRITNGRFPPGTEPPPIFILLFHSLQRTIRPRPTNGTKNRPAPSVNGCALIRPDMVILDLANRFARYYFVAVD
jgi:hypothetical protein